MSHDRPGPSPAGPAPPGGRPWLVGLGLALVPLSLVPQLLGVSPAWWPTTGLVAAVLLVVDRHRMLPVSGLALALLLATVTLADVPSWLGLGGVLVTVGTAHLAAVLLRPPESATSRLRVRDFGSRRYHLVILLVSAGAGLATAAVVLLTSGPELAAPWVVTATLGSVTSLLVVLPLVAGIPSRRALGSRGERLAQRAALLTTLVAVPWLSIATAIVFPVLAWAALRASRREAHVQLVLTALALYLMGGADLGPLDPGDSGLPAPLSTAPEFVYLAALTYLVLPLADSVERLSRANARAEQNAATLERMLAAAPNTLIVVTDADLRITQFNNGAGSILGYTASQVEGRSLEELYEPEEVARLAQLCGTTPALHEVITAQAATGEPLDHELVSRSGESHTVSMSLSPVTEPDGTVQGWLACGDDVTERIRAQRTLEAALEREHESVRRLEEVDHVKQELVSNVSHELRTPITSIAGYAELLADDSLGDLTRPQRDALQRIERNAVRLRSLVDDLLTLSRAEAGRLQLERTDQDLRSVVATAWELFDQQLRHRDLETELTLPPGPVHVLGDHHALERIVVNLLGNAVKFTPDGGSVSLALLRGPGGTARLVVSDTGIGIAEEDQERLFTRFFRSSAATEAAIQGSGLGLSIVQSLVEQHGGRISVRSQPGAGTRVTVDLPCV